jgi:hypothetical protein
MDYDRWSLIVWVAATEEYADEIDIMEFRHFESSLSYFPS